MSQSAAGSPADQTHILVIDDDRRLRELLRKFLADNGYLVATAADAADARTKMQALAFDAIVLDVMMPGQDGFGFTADLRRQSRIPILLLTARDDAEDRITGLEHGADDYLVKPFEPRELLLRLRNILARQANVMDSAHRVRFGRFEFDIARALLLEDGTPVALTSAESDLLRMLAQAQGDVLSRDALCSQPGVNPRTVDVQITRLRRKIETDPKLPQYLITVRGAGYRLHAERVENGSAPSVSDNTK